MIAGWTMGFASLYPSYGSASGHGRSHGVDATGLAYPSPMVGTDANRQTEIEVDATTRLRPWRADDLDSLLLHAADRSEEHTSELQSLMRISYAVFCLKKKNKKANECTTSPSP